MIIIERGLTALAMFAAVAVGTAGPVGAGGPPNPSPAPPVGPSPASATATEMSGPYTALEEGDVPAVWMFTPCGNGCAEVTFPDGRIAQADVENGVWRLDEVDNATAIKCTADGSENPGTAHYSWDPNTLAGETWATDDSGACGAVPGSDTAAVPFNLTAAS
ncbi:MAG: hypothetical protein ACRDTS_20920 [Mycobacterium sp.]